MNALIWILIATIANSLVGFIGVISLWLSDRIMNKLLVLLMAFSAGTLLGGAFFHLLAEAVEKVEPLTAMAYALIGFILFFFIEGYFHWHRCEHCEHPFTYLMLIGDGIHNMIDGLVIAGSFFIDIKLGIMTSIMIIAHEVPQEMGLFGVLLYGKQKKPKALLYSFLAQSTCIIGGVIGYFLSARAEVFSHFLIPFAAGGFIYIAASDLIPEMHRLHEGKISRALMSIVPFLVGIIMMYLLKIFFE
ncbi:MAG: ZIP family metal transporter [Candidatus Nanoarchaeia archaeon]|jgi:zinc and cadmium transporter